MEIVKTPLEASEIGELKVGQWVGLSGDLIVMRDAAHKRLLHSSNPAAELPIKLEGQVIFYAGPTASITEGKGVIGPTTSSRLDKYVEGMLKLGVKGFLGKGPRNVKTGELLKKYRAVYFVTVGGAAALLSKFVKDAKIITYPDLGPEAIYQLKVAEFPVLVACDSKGGCHAPPILATGRHGRGSQ